MQTVERKEAFPRWIARRGLAAATYTTLVTMLDLSGDDGVYRGGQSILAVEAGVSRKSVTRAINELRGIGAINVLSPSTYPTEAIVVWDDPNG